MFSRYFNEEKSLVREFIKKSDKEQLWVDGALFVNAEKLVCTVFNEHAIPKRVICDVDVNVNRFIVRYNGYLIATICR